MQWTSQPPSEPGFYWFRRPSRTSWIGGSYVPSTNGFDLPWIVCVEYRVEGWGRREKLSCFIGSADGPPLASIEGAQWFGPLEAPR